MEKQKGYCINLFDRTNKMQKFTSDWENIIDIVRVNAFDGRPNNGILGCYKSHMKVLTDYDHKENNILVLEDDAVPCFDFNERLSLFIPQLPTDWNIFMLGYWPMLNAKTTQVTKNISQAHRGVLATHCYMINNSFISKLIEIYNNVSSKDMDRIFNILQDRYKVYMAQPSFSYQGGTFSDTSNTNTDYTGTKTFFKDRL